MVWPGIGRNRVCFSKGLSGLELGRRIYFGLNEVFCLGRKGLKVRKLVWFVSVLLI